MGKETAISCVVPVFNGAPFVSETLDSILRQSVPPDEIIVVDDGSTDGTPDVIARYRQHVRYVSKKNGGPAAARNLGIRLAHNEFIAFLDHDDLWHPRKLEIQLSRFELNPTLGFCRTFWQNFWVPELSEEGRQLQNTGYLEPCPGPIQTMLIRRPIFDQVGLLDASKIHRDSAEFLARARDRDIPNEVVPQVLVFRRIHRGNASRDRGDVDTEELLDIAVSSMGRHRLKKTEKPDS